MRTAEEHPYEALSYTWATEDGDCKRTSQITCSDARIWVTKNCEVALRYLRKEGSNRILWVDAICINQKDVKERGHQVGIMRDVYANATEVLIWLGELSTDMAPPSHFTPSAQSESRESAGVLETDEGTESARDIVRTKYDSSNQATQSDAGALISVSEIFFDFVNRMSMDIRRREEEDKDPTLSPLYQELLSQWHIGLIKNRYTAICRGF